jgi:NAD(P)-dependent dehydrogenase (short-subunit alcohol dehydrogenase family)
VAAIEAAFTKFKRYIMTDVVVAMGQIRQANRATGSVRQACIAPDQRQENAEAAAKVLSNAGYDVTVAKVDMSLREDVEGLAETAKRFGRITGLIHA